MNRIKALRKKRNISQRELAEKLNVAQNTISNWENGVRGIDGSVLLRLAAFFGVPVDYLLGRTNDPTDYEDGDLIAGLNKEILDHCNGDVRKAAAAQRAIERDALEERRTRSNPHSIAIRIPVLGRVQAGIPIEAVQDILDYEEITPEMAAQGDYFALQVKGDSMAPRICEGDVVVVRKQGSVENGDITVVLVNGEDATVKKFYQTDQGVKLLSINPTFEPLFYTADEVKSLPVVVIGKVVELRGKL